MNFLKDGLSNVLENLGMVSVNVSDMKLAIFQYTSTGSIDSELGNTIIKSIQNDDDRWDLDIIDTLEIVMNRYTNSTIK